ncbi:pentapeptide repeat-containing protein [Paenibacillus sp. SC116]|uniref:pentapeptide repeat-containing protein n=1 Tax=Paenibacillus sp. SC116 TaxID=2968986 RepID=UPI00215B3866|nr:pentapeptide repeat-containing protein [Paenibacillus sp. SC116]MCR8845939.1 pentapeptide repeat-containing protein [Paenibacillus sp. SC116]
MFTEAVYEDEQFRELNYQQQELRSVKFYDCTFTKCDFSETVFIDCRFSGCVFEGCNLNMIKMVDCEFTDARFSDSKLIGLNWTEACWPKLSRQGMLRFEQSVLSHSTFIGLSLQKCLFNNCLAKDVDFREADLSKADMRYTDFSESLFGNTNLTGADLRHAVNYSIDPGSNRISKAKFMMPEATSLLYSMDIQLVEK